MLFPASREMRLDDSDTSLTADTTEDTSSATDDVVSTAVLITPRRHPDRLPID